MPFGKTYLPERRTFWPSAPAFSPEQGDGLAVAIETLGWRCETWYAGGAAHAAAGGAVAEALARLRDGLRDGPALVGPVDFGHLSYSPHAPHLAGADHYVVALAMEADHLLLHDPAGAPYAVLPVADLLAAWRAERIGYKRGAYTLRTGFRQTERVPRQGMIERTLPLARRNTATDPGGPTTYGGPAALARLAHDLRGEVAGALEAQLLGFSLPTAARRTVDAACFLAEGGRRDAGRSWTGRRSSGDGQTRPRRSAAGETLLSWSPRSPTWSVRLPRHCDGSPRRPSGRASPLREGPGGTCAPTGAGGAGARRL